MISPIDTAIVHIAAWAWREGRRLSPGCRDTSLALVHMMVNRSRAGWHNGDWLKLLEFSPAVSSFEINEQDWLTAPDVGSREWRELLAGAQSSISPGSIASQDLTMSGSARESGFAQSPLRGLYYCSINQLAEKVPLRLWFRENILSHPRTCTVGEVQFFA